MNGLMRSWLKDDINIKIYEEIVICGYSFNMVKKIKCSTKLLDHLEKGENINIFEIFQKLV